MRDVDKKRRGTRLRVYGAPLALLILVRSSGLLQPSFLSGQVQGVQQPADDLPPPHDWSQDLPMKIMKPFTLAAAGDLIMKRAVGQLDEPGFQALMKIISDADMGFANFESSIIDLLQFKGPLAGFTGPKEIAADVKAMGFKMVNRANNHVFDSFLEGFQSTNDLLTEVGVVYAGAGRNLDEARAPRFVATPKGRVGLVGMHNTQDDRGGSSPLGIMGALGASYRVGVTGGRPGISILNVRKSIMLTADQLAAMKKVRDAVYDRRSMYTNPVPSPSFNEPADQLDLFGYRFQVGEKPGENVFTMNPADLRDILRNVRAGKQYSDFMMVAIHSHQSATDLQRAHFGDYPPEFLVTLAHAAVDNGADAFLGSGPHVLRGIEIYKGKPIFYGLAEFVNDMDTTPSGDPATEGTLIARGPNSVLDPINYESILTLSRYDKGKLQEVRLFPVEQGWAGPLSRRGTPMLVSGETAQRILRRLQTLSAPFGTKIAVEGNIGVIRVSQ
jgi:poly-gamma-glutamate synthesis protein (capsule biosynthesis protein)